MTGFLIFGISCNDMVAVGTAYHGAQAYCGLLRQLIERQEVHRFRRGMSSAVR